MYFTKKLRNKEAHNIHTLLNMYLKNNIIKKKHHYFKDINKHVYIAKTIFKFINNNDDNFYNVIKVILNKNIVKYIYKLLNYVCKVLCLSRCKKKCCFHLKSQSEEYYIEKDNLAKCSLIKTYLINIYYNIFKNLCIILAKHKNGLRQNGSLLFNGNNNNEYNDNNCKTKKFNDKNGYVIRIQKDGEHIRGNFLKSLKKKINSYGNITSTKNYSTNGWLLISEQNELINYKHLFRIILILFKYNPSHCLNKIISEKRKKSILKKNKHFTNLTNDMITVSGLSHKSCHFQKINKSHLICNNNILKEKLPKDNIFHRDKCVCFCKKGKERENASYITIEKNSHSKKNIQDINLYFFKDHDCFENVKRYFDNKKIHKTTKNINIVQCKDKMILSLYKYLNSFLRTIPYIFSFKKRNKTIFSYYNKIVKKEFINFIFKKKTQNIHFIFSINKSLFNLLKQNNFAFKNGIRYESQSIKVCTIKLKIKNDIPFFYVFRKKQYNNLRALLRFEKKSFHLQNVCCLFFFLFQFVKRKKKIIFKICSKIKNIISNIKNENYITILKSLLILKNFLYNHKSLFEHVLRILENYHDQNFIYNSLCYETNLNEANTTDHQIGKKNEKSNKEINHERIQIIASDTLQCKQCACFNKEKPSMHSYEKGNDSPIKIGLLFAHLFIYVFSLYLNLLLKSLLKYRSNTKKKYILMKIIIINKYGILQTRHGINGVVTNVKKFIKEKKKSNDNFFYRSNILSLIYYIVNTWKVLTNLSNMYNYNIEYENNMKIILTNFVLTLLRDMNSVFIKNNKKCSSKKWKYYKMRGENMHYIFGNHLIYMFLKKNLLNFFESFIFGTSKDCDNVYDKTKFENVSNEVIHKIVCQNKEKGMALIYIYFELDKTFLKFYSNFISHTIKRKRIKERNCVRSKIELLSFDHTIYTLFYRMAHFRKFIINSKNKIYIKMINKYYLLLIILICYKREKEKNISKVMTTFLKILVLLSEQKNIVLQLYFYKIKILEFLLHYINDGNFEIKKKEKRASKSNKSSPLISDNKKIQSTNEGACDRVYHKYADKDCSKKSASSNSSYNTNSQFNDHTKKIKFGKNIIPPLCLDKIKKSFNSFDKCVSDEYDEKISILSDEISSKIMNPELGKYIDKVDWSENISTNKLLLMSEEYCRDKNLNDNFHKMEREYLKCESYNLTDQVKYKNRYKDKLNDEIVSVKTWVLLLIFSLITSYNKKCLNDLYFNENYYDEYQNINKQIEKKVFKKCNEIKKILKIWLKVFNKYFPFSEVINSEHLPIIQIIQSFINNNIKKNNVIGNIKNEGKKYFINDQTKSILYNLSVVKNLKNITFLKKINEYGNGKIFLCSHNIFNNNFFIIKLIDIANNINENYIFKNIFNEIKCLLTFQNSKKGICQMYTYGIIPNCNHNGFTYYLLMKYYEGNLKDLINYAHVYYLKEIKKIRGNIKQFFLPIVRKEKVEKIILNFKIAKIIKQITKRCKGNFIFCYKYLCRYTNVYSCYTMILKSRIFIKIIQLKFILFILNIFIQIIEQIMYVHKKKIIHFDINTCNILIDFKKTCPLLMCKKYKTKKNNNINHVNTKQDLKNTRSQIVMRNCFVENERKTNLDFIRPSYQINNSSYKKQNKFYNNIDISMASFNYRQYFKRIMKKKDCQYIVVPSIVISDFGESKFFLRDTDFIFFRKNRGNEMLAAPELLTNKNKYTHSKSKHKNVAKSLRKHSFVSLEFYKCLKKVKMMIKKKLENQKKFQKKKINMSKSDIWLLGSLLYEMITNDSLFNYYNFIYIKIYEKKELLNELINKKIKMRFKELKYFFKFFFQFDLKKRKDLYEIYQESIKIYNFYFNQLKSKEEILKKTNLK
ncbi:protein kinase, putative [Plasmodium chabaudi chabaudi]|uniref:non-specific serine/threonine protein kinase n=1 Tax=Plasmodium chabaudi chabaudi TaxID=31271 RepID=A0A4V0K2F9_PLACU|nr:protein kinase, putative [Plasmodium chabaudi chabaudi]VTZ66454.1 protein kinase, putative [Plasmodium chabaudi chabaudi]|eukprot:XP_736114.2 protein kinase, putative [Plasmodium chabaudi chabaudi]